MTDPVYVVGDIGGTYARFAHVDGNQPILRDVEVLLCASYKGPEQALKEYTSTHKLTDISGCCLAIATHLQEGAIKLTNNHWQFKKQTLSSMMNAPLSLINDLVANAYALRALPEEDYIWLNKNRPTGKQLKVVLGSGTGLGVAMITPNGEVLASEAGHVGFAPYDKHEYALLDCLMQRYQRVSIERLLSGGGLSSLYWVHGTLQNNPLDITPAEIIERANQGELMALSAIRDFFNILSTFAGDIALMSLAKGGVYLVGGVLDKLWPFYDADVFMERLVDKGRFSAFCARLPIARITTEYLGMLGCAYALHQNLAEA